MLIYILIIILIAILSIIYDKKEYSSAKTIWFYAVLIILICLAGFRGDIGTDTMTYRNWFDQLPPLAQMSSQTIANIRFEPLFVIICSFCKSISSEWLLPQLLFSAYINCTILIFIKRNTSKVFLAILLYFLSTFYVLNCEEIRQALSFSFVLIGFQWWKKKKSIWYYYIPAIIAIGFHSSALVFLFLPLMPDLFSRPLFLAISCILVFVLAALFRDNMYASVAFFGIDYLTELASAYEGDALSGQAVQTMMNTINRIVVSVVIPIFYYYISRSVKSNYYQLFLFYLFSAIANIQMILFYRFIHILQIIAIIVLMNGLLKANRRYKFFLVIILILYSYSTIYNSIFLYDSFYEQYKYELFIPYKVYTMN